MYGYEKIIIEEVVIEEAQRKQADSRRAARRRQALCPSRRGRKIQDECERRPIAVGGQPQQVEDGRQEGSRRPRRREALGRARTTRFPAGRLDVGARFKVRSNRADKRGDDRSVQTAGADAERAEDPSADEGSDHTNDHVADHTVNDRNALRRAP